MSVKSAINKHGIVFTYRHKTVEGTYDPASGTVSGPTVVDYELKGYPYNYDLMEIDGTSIVKGDRKVLIYPQTTSGSAFPEPTVNGVLIGMGDTASIVNVRAIYSGGRPVAYILQVRE